MTSLVVMSSLEFVLYAARSNAATEIRTGYRQDWERGHVNGRLHQLDCLFPDDTALIQAVRNEADFLAFDYTKRHVKWKRA